VCACVGACLRVSGRVEVCRCLSTRTCLRLCVPVHFCGCICVCLRVSVCLCLSLSVSVRLCPFWVCGSMACGLPSVSIHTADVYQIGNGERGQLLGGVPLVPCNTATHCSFWMSCLTNLQHTATHGNSLHTATHGYSCVSCLINPATHCRIMQYAAEHSRKQ